MTDTTVRAAFEQTMKAKWPHVSLAKHCSNGAYVDGQAHWLWHGWQAALSAPPTEPIAWMVRSVSTNFKGLYHFEGHARDMMDNVAAPKDAEFIELIDRRAAIDSAMKNGEAL